MCTTIAASRLFPAFAAIALLSGCSMASGGGTRTGGGDDRPVTTSDSGGWQATVPWHENTIPAGKAWVNEVRVKARARIRVDYEFVSGSGVNFYFFSERQLRTAEGGDFDEWINRDKAITGRGFYADVHPAGVYGVVFINTGDTPARARVGVKVRAE